MGTVRRREVSAGGAPIQLRGYDEMQRALAKIGRDAAKESTDIIRENVKPILRRARANVSKSKGTHRHVSPAVVSIRVAPNAAALVLDPGVDDLAWAIEFGMKTGGMTPRYKGGGRGTITRYARPYSGAGASTDIYRGFYGPKISAGTVGYVVGNAIKRGHAKFERDTFDDLERWMGRVMDKAGVPK